MPTDTAWSALAEAYEEYAEEIVSFCQSRKFSKEDSEEIVQETFIKTYEYLQADRKVNDMRPFLFSVASNLTIDWIRKQKKKTTKEVSLDFLSENGFEVAGMSPERNLHHKLDMKTLLHSREALKEPDFNLLKLRYLRGLSPKEIALQTGLSSNAVSIRLHRIVKTVTSSLQVA